MLDPGRYLAEAIYFLQYTLAQMLWAINRATLSIAVIAETVNTWVTDNVGYFVQLLVNALSAPLAGMFILALTALGFWYALNNVVPTNRWVDPSKLFSYGLIAFFFFSSPIVVIEMMEDVRQSLNAGIDQALIDGAAGDIFDTSMDGTDTGLPGAIPDVNSDGVIGSFDLVTAFMLVANLDELDSSEFPVDFEATYFPFGDPSGIDLSDEADQELAKALASDGIERLFFALVAIPTAIAEHFLRLALTGVAIFLYTGVPFAMLFAFFVYTQAFLGAYLRQFINLLIETLMSVIITAIMVGLLAAAGQEGLGLYIGASLIALMVLLWRIKSALKLAAAAFHLFGGAMLTGGAGGMELAGMARQAVTGAATTAGAALTGGATLAAGGALLASAAALRADGGYDGAYLGSDPDKTEGRVRQLKTIAGYALGRSETGRSLIEGMHETRTLARNFRDGEVRTHEPDLLDYLRAGSSMSGFGSSPWLAMRLSPSLRAAYDQIGGRRSDDGLLLDDAYTASGEPVSAEGVDDAVSASGGNRGGRERAEPATDQQLAYLRRLGLDTPQHLSRGQAIDLIDQVRHAAPRSPERPQGAASATVLPQALTQTLLSRFTTLERALMALTEALAGPGGSRAAPLLSPGESANGPIPEWLEQAVPIRPGAEIKPDEHAALAGRLTGDVSSGPGQPTGPASAGTDQPQTQPQSEPSGVIFLEPPSDARQQVIVETLARLAERQSLAGQAAHRTLVTYTGTQNATLIQEAVSTVTAPVVEEAARGVASLAAQYREQGRDDAAVLTAFQQGSALEAVRQAVKSPLSEAQLAAVADMVLLPQRRLSDSDLVAVIGHQAAAGATTEQAVIDALGMPIAFGSLTGSVRGVLAGARTLQLTPAELTHIAQMIRDGLREVVQAELIDAGRRPDLVRDLVNDIAALPAVMVVPQTARRPDAAAGLADEA